MEYSPEKQIHKIKKRVKIFNFHVHDDSLLHKLLSFISKYDNYLSFAFGTHQIGTSQQSLIGTELEVGEKYRKHSETS